MAETRDVRQQIEHLIERAQDELIEASRQLANSISKETERFVPPISNDVERLVDDVFDFAERVIKGQRKMVNDVVKTINEQTDRAADAGRAVTRRVAKRAPAKKKAVARA
jgi:sugar-specific transcriptional regulator TrmB